MLPDPSTPFGQRVARHLRDDLIVWLTTVGQDGMPQPNPVWFLWDGESILVYNHAETNRLRHVRRRPQVSLNFTGGDGDMIVINGLAAIPEDEPPANETPAFLAKYGARMEMGVEPWARHFSVPLRVRPTKVRGHPTG